MVSPVECWNQGNRFAATVLIVAIAAVFASPVRAQQVVLLVNGTPITDRDIASREKFLEMSNHKKPSRQETINTLIDETLELKEAARFALDPSETEVQQAYDNVASGMGVDAQKLTQMLTNGGASADTLKNRLKAQIAWTTLVRGRYKSSLEIADKDVEAELQLHQPADTNQVGYEYIVRPIVLIVPRGSPDVAFEARKRDADALRGRFTSCADGIPFARGLPEVAVRDPINKSSADLPPALRTILDSIEVGHLTPPETTSEGVQMFAVCSKKESKTEAPGLKEVRDKMFEKRFGVKANRYLADLRRQAMIEYK
ncbi:MAG TPA: peptidylprolyl isomerase [Xanthobacteraceae bacterium]|nr:peptidylprolyl isomerase [Xanthobacteraceae bacterium]